MKKISKNEAIFLMIALICLVSVVCLSISKVNSEAEPVYEAKIFDNFYIYKNSQTNCTIYEKDKFDEQLGSLLPRYLINCNDVNISLL